MKVVLINAPHDTSKMFGFRKRTTRLVHQPLGIGYIASGLQRAGHNAVFIDSQALGFGIAETLDRLKEESPGLVGIPCFAMGRFIVYELVRAIKKEYPFLPVVLGGPQLTAFTDQVFSECAEIDMALCGEADYTMAELATRLEAKSALDGIAGLVLRDSSGAVRREKPPAIIEDLDAIPFPARTVYQEGLYHPMPFMISQPKLAGERVITSRGCYWGKCRFCYQSGAYAPCFRRRSPGNVVEEIRILATEHGAKFIFFPDDNFFQNELWVERFCDLLDEIGIPLKWSAFGRVDTVTESMLHRAAQSGCIHISYGFESGNQEMLNFLSKGIRLEQSRQAVLWTKAAGIEIAGFMMLGLPRETPAMAKQTIRFAVELDTEYMKFDPYHVLEGTALAEVALQEGRLIEHDNEQFLDPSYVPNTYKDSAQINRMIRNAYWQFYFRPKYIFRALWRMRNPLLFMEYMEKLWLGLQVIFHRY